jgi:hypothetical protein
MTLSFFKMAMAKKRKEYLLRNAMHGTHKI